MKDQENTDFNRIAEAIHFLRKNFKTQPRLEDVANKLHLSPHHFQRMFTDWAGVSPKKFLQYTTLEYAKKLLKENGNSLLDTALDSGLSGTGRLHDLFVNIEGMTPGEYKNGGKDLSINYSFAESPFGKLLVASTSKGICYISFFENEKKAFQELKSIFPNANYSQTVDLIQQNALFIFSHDWGKLNQIKLHLKGTDFQLKVWETLLKIPMGNLSTYGQIAERIERPNASRAVGTAIGNNPVAFLIPCHRVIQSNGDFGEYHWGSSRKIAMIGWEAAKTDLVNRNDL
ncbi:methylated-DNA--[protein]-cysteine S-methyltransferase [Leptospira sarikeiensis]|uniref:methylated-DNA--[protein]-cysteine S-methyltransferase n=1 Tax=Leptospira sarikeiensis TaxID=2484943 RepID=A0A4R9KCA4_9LEPT|nr:methylated-DNA--[protein]-cysteine S-methyltransferase [Leptospira sarikeiensis]TGL63661.1 methylated-DNA--[protein]-cysteine S-methyltransferase [Leptospira sarikeiensis]